MKDAQGKNHPIDFYISNKAPHSLQWVIELKNTLINKSIN
jgi:hypothetical protein